MHGPCAVFVCVHLCGSVAFEFLGRTALIAKTEIVNCRKNAEVVPSTQHELEQSLILTRKINFQTSIIQKTSKSCCGLYSNAMRQDSVTLSSYHISSYFVLCLDSYSRVMRLGFKGILQVVVAVGEPDCPG